MAAKILFVDDDEENLIVVEAHCGAAFDILTARSAEQALLLLEQCEVGVVVADQRMPGISGVELLAQVRERNPDIVRVLLTAYSDLSAAIGAINCGQVRRYLRKPWQPDELIAELRDALDVYETSRKLRAVAGRLRETERVYALGVIAAGVGHELRNPISWIQGNLQLINSQTRALETLCSEVPIPEELERRVHKIKRALADAEDGVNRVFDIVRGIGAQQATTPSEEVVALDEVLRLTLRMVATEVNEATALECEVEGSPRVKGGMTKIGQIVLNLVVNAIKALPKDAPGQNRISIKVFTEGSSAHLHVADNGPGVPENQRERIFDPFFTTSREGGTGLGLAICRRISEELGGTIDVSRDPTLGGALFRLALPLA
jgi:signal transduction histidine kinase